MYPQVRLKIFTFDLACCIILSSSNFSQDSRHQGHLEELLVLKNLLFTALYDSVKFVDQLVALLHNFHLIIYDYSVLLKVVILPSLSDMS